MNVQIKHNGTDITQYVVAYTRDCAICTGIGTFEVKLSGNYPTTISPWDTFLLYEGGIKKGTYFVSIVTSEEAQYDIIVTCQDNSKRLSDYFITESKLISSPSYVKDWISYYLDEVGLSYSYNTDDVGNLLSNDTYLGMTGAYDQIMALVQLNGWYFYFDADGTAIIGTQDSDMSDIAESFDNTDIIDISEVITDKMYRNRALVWGGTTWAGSRIIGESSGGSNLGYDSKDIRTVVIANSNIDSTATATSLAKKLITEYARLDREVTFTVHGGRDLVLGDVVFVDNAVFYGSGRITSLTSLLSSDGFTTVITLDQRCPRLFGYYGYTDRVYASTYGDGVYYKHINYDTSWTSMSSGLIANELDKKNIVDLYKNNGVLSCVSAEGDLYLSIEGSNYWRKITLPQLETIISDETVLITPMARAVIHDKVTNRVRIVVDNNTRYSPAETPDIDYSDFEVGNQNRSWIMEFTPYGLYIGSYPIYLDGGFNNFSALDIDNDGQHDFVSVAGKATEFYPDYVSGLIRNDTIPGVRINAKTNPEEKNYGEGETPGIAASIWLENGLYIENTAGSSAEMVVLYRDTSDTTLYKISKCVLTESSPGYFEYIVETTINFHTDSYANRYIAECYGIYKLSTDVYRVFARFASDYNSVTVRYKDVDMEAETVTGLTTLLNSWSGYNYKFTVSENTLHIFPTHPSGQDAYHYYLNMKLLYAGYEKLIGSGVDLGVGGTLFELPFVYGFPTTNSRVSVAALFRMVTAWDGDSPTESKIYFYLNGVAYLVDTFDESTYYWDLNYDVIKITNAQWAFRIRMTQHEIANHKYYLAEHDGTITEKGSAWTLPITSYDASLDFTSFCASSLAQMSYGFICQASINKYTIDPCYIKKISATDYDTVSSIPATIGDFTVLFPIASTLENGDSYLYVGLDEYNNGVLFTEDLSFVAYMWSTGLAGSTYISYMYGHHIISWIAKQKYDGYNYLHNTLCVMTLRNSDMMETIASTILRREDDNSFTQVEVSLEPKRIEISNYFPLITYGAGLESIRIYDNFEDSTEVRGIVFLDGVGGTYVGDIRTSYIDNGVDSANHMYIATSRGVFDIDLDSESAEPVQTLLEDEDVRRLEVTNYKTPYQYAFVSTVEKISETEDDFHFQQKDYKSAATFTTYDTGFPKDYITTKIRTDDRL